MAESSEIWRREDLNKGMRQVLEQTIEERVERYLEVAHQGIIPNHHFAAASSECIDLYRDGYSLSAVMVSQAVTEGIWRLVLERNQVQADRDRSTLATTLVERRILSAECAEAFGRIWRSFRNDVHHMNPSVTGVPFGELARRNLLDLATIEREIFAVTFDNGKLVPIVDSCFSLFISSGCESRLGTRRSAE
jgi:hypothetical protein